MMYKTLYLGSKGLGQLHVLGIALDLLRRPKYGYSVNEER